MRWMLAIICLPFLIISGALLALSFRSIMYMDVISRHENQLLPPRLVEKVATLESMDREFYFAIRVWQYPSTLMNAPGMQGVIVPQTYWRYFSESQSTLPGLRKNRGAWDFSFSYRGGNPVSSWDGRFPQWLPIVLTGLPPMVWVFIIGDLSASGGGRCGECAKCADTICATPDQCPECGTVGAKENVSSGPKTNDKIEA